MGDLPSVCLYGFSGSPKASRDTHIINKIGHIINYCESITNKDNLIKAPIKRQDVWSPDAHGILRISHAHCPCYWDGKPKHMYTPCKQMKQYLFSCLRNTSSIEVYSIQKQIRRSPITDQSIYLKYLYLEKKNTIQKNEKVGLQNYKMNYWLQKIDENPTCKLCVHLTMFQSLYMTYWHKYTPKFEMLLVKFFVDVPTKSRPIQDWTGQLLNIWAQNEILILTYADISTHYMGIGAKIQT